MSMKILALIPARRNSKRLPNKNSMILGGKPLVEWTIQSAREIESICNILVSTDDPNIVKIAHDNSVLAPWLRPPELCTDEATSVAVAVHGLNWYESLYEKVDGLLLLQPTSPFREKSEILKGIELFETFGFRPVIGVRNSNDHPMWALRNDGGLLVPYFQQNGFGMRSQDLEESFTVNGSFYLVSPKQLREEKSFIGSENVPLVINSFKGNIDIDSLDDYDIARRVVEA